MEASLFSEYAPYFPVVVGKVTEKLNGENASQEPKMLHKEMLKEEFSADLRWGSTVINDSVVAADVVSLESSLPLKSRPSLKNANGTLPKMGVKYKQGEQLITDVAVLEASVGAEDAQVIARIFDDVPRSIKGMEVRKEILFRKALSSGYSLTEDEDNTGVGVRANFGYQDDHKFKGAAKWSGASAKPVTDLRKMVDAAIDNGDPLNHIFIQREYFNLARQSKEGKELFAFANAMTVAENVTLPTPSRAAFMAALQDEFNVQVHLIEGTFRVEGEDGKAKKVQPWEDGAIVGTPDTVVGRLVYGRTAEMLKPTEGVEHAMSGTHTLVMKWGANDPKTEWTGAEAICLPVIDGGAGIYVLNVEK